MRYKNTKAHGTHCTMCPSSVHIRTHPYLSVRHCSQYRLCAMCHASQQNTQPCAIKIQKRTALWMPCALSDVSDLSDLSDLPAHSIGSALSEAREPDRATADHFAAARCRPVGERWSIKKSKVPYSQAGVRRKPHGLPESGVPGKWALLLGGCRPKVPSSVSEGSPFFGEIRV